VTNVACIQLIGLAVKILAEEIYNVFIHAFPADVRGELHQFLLPKASMAENIVSANKREEQQYVPPPKLLMF
jgi:hypothetical protein